MTKEELNNDNFTDFILKQANKPDKEKALSNIADRFIKDNPEFYNTLLENEASKEVNATKSLNQLPQQQSKKSKTIILDESGMDKTELSEIENRASQTNAERKKLMDSNDFKEKIKKKIEGAMKNSFLELRKEVAEQNKSTLRKTADASLKIVEKFCYAALGAVSLAVGSVFMLEAKALKFGTFGLYNSFDFSSRPVKEEEAHDFSKGKIGITRKGGRVNHGEEMGSEALKGGAYFLKKAYTTRIITEKQNTKTMAEKVKAGAETIGSRNK